MKYLIFAILDFFSWPLTFLLMAAAAFPVACGSIYILDSFNIYICLSFIPLYYFIWLILFLILSSIEMSIVSLFFKKPQSMLVYQSIKTAFTTAIIHVISRRIRLIWVLPMSEVFLIPAYTLPFLNKLVFKAYCPGKLRIGKMSAVYSFLHDPDLCIIGNNTVIGAKSELVSHYLKTLEDGNILYRTAPIKIGNDVTIGGSSTVLAGVEIKNGAILAAGSIVMPQTVIEENEIWGGNPAKFIKNRKEKN